MSAAQHIEWLNLVEKTGPFLAVGVLSDAFPQGLEKVETRKRQRVRSAYDEWRDAVDAGDPQLAALHAEWVRLILFEVLEYEASVLKPDGELPDSLVYREPLSGAEVRPDWAVISDGKPRLLITVNKPATDLDSPLDGESWSATPIERMIALCRALEVPVGMVTNGEEWSLVSVPPNQPTSVGTWFARIWQQEPVTLQAFVSLLEVRRCFGPTEGMVETFFVKSLEHQDELTDTLGEQVRRAVEVLVQALDRADQDRNRELLSDISPAQLYEAGLTVMMRMVVLLCAEERKLLLLGEPIYDQHYAVSTLRSRLLEEKERLGEEVLERRHDAWSRLLSVFRAVFGGIEHETLRLPALGGSLFDPDRFPFLEGRAVGTRWLVEPAVPLPIDNRTVLMLLNALQVLEQSVGAQLLSYEALDVEQIGHVYEGLLERTVKRVPETTLGLIGSGRIINPNVALRELEEMQTAGKESLVSFLKETTGRSESALLKSLTKSVDDAAYHRILLSAAGNIPLADRIRPFALLLRTDSWGEPLVYRDQSFIVTFGAGRRETGTHYTPKLLTDPIVRHTLEPLVYTGPAEGKPMEEWRLKSPADLLALKVCDMAMGSGAFLVQVCRWLADRLVEAWDAEERSGRSISIEGSVLEQPGETELMPRDKAERVIIGRRLIASRCIYGVDINPMAVELAKVSLWLITMMRNRPFSFLDHALKCGDSLLGISSFKQLESFSIRAPETDHPLFDTMNLWRHIELAVQLRQKLETLPSHTCNQISEKADLHTQAEDQLAKLKASADFLVAAELDCPNGKGWASRRAIAASHMQAGWKQDGEQFRRLGRESLGGRHSFHWPIEFPEVFISKERRNQEGFDAIVGNPPWFFLSGKANPVARLRREGNTKQANELEAEIACYTNLYPELSKGAKDYYKWFTGRGKSLIRCNGNLGLVLSNSFISLPKYRDVRECISGFNRLNIIDLGFGYFKAVVSCALIVGIDKTQISASLLSNLFYADFKNRRDVALANIRSDDSEAFLQAEITNGDFMLFKSASAEFIYSNAKHFLGEIIEIKEGHHHLSFAGGERQVNAVIDSTLARLVEPKIGVGWVPLDASGIEYHKGQRFILRKTGDSLVAAMVPTNEIAIAHQNVYVCKPKQGVGISAKAICALISSEVCTRLYQDGPLGQKGRTMAQLRIQGVKRIPLPSIDEIVEVSSKLEMAYDDDGDKVNEIAKQIYSSAFAECP